ncbi:hypothetical protein SAMD00019534_020270 [Acytostelium subglobosum LB1]|uniref:hypothetical protein n=1 Tax=Acytostelium subglobosum LB1 TaxID=1410327 RepID=UPI000644A548|nr:hypothetical protein SAMD00019534_020270 [Acytostelium subglobosum LB1]GAM18852.1 hypothetical protein SAMD00019534_020270 [Acytostelium subglobosum LB1]|eukprot:XP_012758072.1 hypothetical protein SAMD00019534_020270 [Acytostelium subglobosum LB1]
MNPLDQRLQQQQQQILQQQQQQLQQHQQQHQQQQQQIQQLHQQQPWIQRTTNNLNGSLASLIRMSNMSRELHDILSGSFDSNDLGEIITNSILNPGSALNSSIHIMQHTAPVLKGVLGDVTFLKQHSRSVKAVDFSPRDDHIFSSAGLDGKCVTYDARQGRILSYTTIAHHGPSQLTGYGTKLALATSNNKMLIYDIETSAVTQSFDKCVPPGGVSIRCPIAVESSNVIMVPNATGRGIAFLDLRAASIVNNMEDIHEAQINDIVLLDSAWAREVGAASGNMPAILTASSDSTCRVSTRHYYAHALIVPTDTITTRPQIVDTRSQVLKKFEHRTQVFSVAHTPEAPSITSNSCIAIGSDKLNVYPLQGQLPVYSSNFPTCKYVSRLNYSRSGRALFCATNDGHLRMYNRINGGYDLKGIVYKHSKDIQDMAISRNDEYIITASSDFSVGLIRMGDPISGPTEVGEII